MSRHLLAFLVSQVRTVRLICKDPGCGVIFEMSLDALAGAKWQQCPACGADFNPTRSGTGLLMTFATAAKALQEYHKVLDLEFVLPADPKAAP
jgi:hypothetical protein